MNMITPASPNTQLSTNIVKEVCDGSFHLHIDDMVCEHVHSVREFRLYITLNNQTLYDIDKGFQVDLYL